MDLHPLPNGVGESWGEGLSEGFHEVYFAAASEAQASTRAADEWVTFDMTPATLSHQREREKLYSPSVNNDALPPAAVVFTVNVRSVTNLSR